MPYSKFQYCCMAIGLKPAPDIAQSIIEKVLSDCDVDAYIDDIGVFDGELDEHAKLLDMILTHLGENGYCVNPNKCEWCMKGMDFLGHWLTPDGIKPW